MATWQVVDFIVWMPASSLVWVILLSLGCRSCCIRQTVEGLSFSLCCNDSGAIGNGSSWSCDSFDNVWVPSQPLFGLVSRLTWSPKTVWQASGWVWVTTSRYRLGRQVAAAGVELRRCYLRINTAFVRSWQLGWFFRSDSFSRNHPSLTKKLLIPDVHLTWFENTKSHCFFEFLVATLFLGPGRLYICLIWNVWNHFTWFQAMFLSRSYIRYWTGPTLRIDLMHLFLLLNLRLFRCVFDKMQCLDLHKKRLHTGAC